MCRQLPNVASIPFGYVQVEPDKAQSDAADLYDAPVMDDTYDALIRLGAYSMPCLVTRLTDTQWMPDPRSEPLVGDLVVADIAYRILLDQGVRDVMPGLANKKLLAVDYFAWPRAGDHRQRLQNAVRSWLSDHPDHFGASPILLNHAPARARFQMSDTELAEARTRFSRLRPGMTPDEILRLAGKPDATELQDESGEPVPPNASHTDLLSTSRNERLAYVYFVERWTEQISYRDPLHDRYVILYFSAEGKFTRMFSNVAEIPPIFPQAESSWQRLMWGQAINKQ